VLAPKRYCTLIASTGKRQGIRFKSGGVVCQRLGLFREARPKDEDMQGYCTLGGDRQWKLAFLGDALFAAHQPLRLELDFQRATQE